MEQKFNIGDVVRVTTCKNFPRLNGRVGTITDIDLYNNGGHEYIIRFEDNPDAFDWDWVKFDEVEAI